MGVFDLPLGMTEAFNVSDLHKEEAGGYEDAFITKTYDLGVTMVAEVLSNDDWGDEDANSNVEIGSNWSCPPDQSSFLFGRGWECFGDSLPFSGGDAYCGKLSKWTARA